MLIMLFLNAYATSDCESQSSCFGEYLVMKIVSNFVMLLSALWLYFLSLLTVSAIRERKWMVLVGLFQYVSFFFLLNFHFLNMYYLNKRK